MLKEHFPPNLDNTETRRKSEKLQTLEGQGTLVILILSLEASWGPEVAVSLWAGRVNALVPLERTGTGGAHCLVDFLLPSQLVGTLFIYERRFEQSTLY